MKTVLAGGRFNIIHPGHVYFLKKAKTLGDRLVVIIASDKTVKTAGKSLLFPDTDRKRMVESLRFVDKVIIGYPIRDPEGYARIIKRVKPDIIAVGHDQRVLPSSLKEMAKRAHHPVSVVRIKPYKSYKTRKIMR